MNVEVTHLQKQNIIIAVLIVAFTLLVAWIIKTLGLDIELIKYILGGAFGSIVGLGFNTKKADVE